MIDVMLLSDGRMLVWSEKKREFVPVKSQPDFKVELKKVFVEHGVNGYMLLADVYRYLMDKFDSFFIQESL